MKIFLCPMPEKDDDYLGKLKIYIDNYLTRKYNAIIARLLKKYR